MIGCPGVDKGDGVLKLRVGEIDNVFLPDLRGSDFYGLSVEGVDHGAAERSSRFSRDSKRRERGLKVDSLRVFIFTTSFLRYNEIKRIRRTRDADQLRRGREWTFKTSNNGDLNGFHEACHEKSERTRTHTPRAMQIP